MGNFSPLLFAFVLLTLSPMTATADWFDLGSVKVRSIGETHVRVFDYSTDELETASALEAISPTLGDQYLQILGQIPPSRIRADFNDDAWNLVEERNLGLGDPFFISAREEFGEKVKLLLELPSFPILDFRLTSVIQEPSLLDYIHWESVTLATPLAEGISKATPLKIDLKAVPPFVIRSTEQKAAQYFAKNGRASLEFKIYLSSFGLEGHFRDLVFSGLLAATEGLDPMIQKSAIRETLNFLTGYSQRLYLADINLRASLESKTRHLPSFESDWGKTRANFIQAYSYFVTASEIMEFHLHAPRKDPLDGMIRVTQADIERCKITFRPN